MRKVLIVDDEQTFLKSLAEILNTSGERFRILFAENGARALQVLESERVDLVMTDIRMPVMNGLELLSQMRKRYPDIPVIVMSSFLEPEVESEILVLGASSCVDKLSGLESLKETILKNLSGGTTGWSPLPTRRHQNPGQDGLK